MNCITYRAREEEDIFGMRFVRNCFDPEIFYVLAVSYVFLQYFPFALYDVKENFLFYA